VSCDRFDTFIRFVRFVNFFDRFDKLNKFLSKKDLSVAYNDGQQVCLYSYSAVKSEFLLCS
jgi:hypothetical protein